MGKQLEALMPRNTALLHRRRAVLEKTLQEAAEDGDHERTCEERELLLINAAIQRIQEGTYGQCSNCASGITVQRLQALPFVERCIDCQHEHEKTGISDFPLEVKPQFEVQNDD